MMHIRLNGVRLGLDEPETELTVKMADLLGMATDAIRDVKIVRKSLDARRERPPFYVYIVECLVPDETAAPGESMSGVTVKKVTPHAAVVPNIKVRRPPERPVVIGSGPAGLFAALTLAESGVPVLLLERGKPVPQRVSDVAAFWGKGVLNTESNVHFGEGGAGTFSDGKLTSRRQNPDVQQIKETLVRMGAPASILVDAKPHIGTDRLRSVVVKLRKRLAAFDCDVRFDAKVTDFTIRHGRIRGLIVNHEEELSASRVVLAAGQAAEDTYRILLARGVRLVPKAFAMGVRIEHPQEWINRIQYGKWSGHPALPPAEYFVTAKAGDRSVYSFCMCPGGRIIGCSSEPETVVTNGMSFSLRDGSYANSAMVVNIRTDDFSGGSPLAGFDFRRLWEQKAYRLGDAGYQAPAQRLTDFLQGRSGQVGGTSFLPGVKSAQLSETLPSFVSEALKQGIRHIEKKMPGFVTDDAIMVGVETRTSSPVRIERKSNGESIGVEGLYPCGEGSGYAGGIVSSALDGMRAAQSVLMRLRTLP
jgi:uncharacterized FAD-dependent dehydrogenase